MRRSTPRDPPAPASPPVASNHGGLFSGGRRRHELETENAQLRKELEWMREQFMSESVKGTRAAAEIARQGMAGAEIAAQVGALRQRLTAVRQHVDEAERELAGRHRELDELRAQIVETEDIALLQECGICEYRYQLDNSVTYKERLSNVKKKIKEMVRAGVFLASTDWAVNGSKREGQKMIKNFSKLILRAYTGEAENCVRTVRPHSRAATVARLAKTRDTIAWLG